MSAGAKLGILGRNWVGKTTLACIMGLTETRRGRIRFVGSDITAMRTWRRARAT